MTFQKGVQGKDTDYLEVLAAWNDAIEKGMKAKKLPTANPYLLAVQKALSDRIYPHYRKRWAYSISDWKRVGKKSRDAPTSEEIRRMRQSDAQDSEHAEDGH